MASPRGMDGVTEASDLTFSAANIDKELNPQKNKNFEVDTISTEMATSLEIKVHFVFCFDFILTNSYIHV